jgi:hypothetical protein
MRFDMTEIRDLQFGIHVSPDAPSREEWLAEHDRMFPSDPVRRAEQANADFLYNLGADTQLEAVGEDDLDAHMHAPIFAQLTLESQEYLRDDEVTELAPSVWDQFEDGLNEWRGWMAWAWSLVLGGAFGVIGWLWLVSA